MRATRSAVGAGWLLMAACMPPAAETSLPPVARLCPDSTTPVRWLFPVAAGDNRTLDRWCRTVGPVLVHATPAAGFSTPLPGGELTVAVWNINAGAGDLLTFLTHDLGVQCVGEASSLSPGARPFVLLLQEALHRSARVPDGPRYGVVAPAVPEEKHPGPRIGAVDVARRCGLAFLYAPQARNGFESTDGLREDRGPAILATVPLEDFVVAELPLESSRRVVTIATARGANGRRLRLASVHLITTPPPWRVLTTGNTSRLRQAMGLVDALDRLERDAVTSPPTLAAGDLNTWSNDEAALRYLRRHFDDSPAPLAEPTRGVFPTDHVLFRQGVTGAARIVPGSFRRAPDRYHSDHYPIVLRLAFGDDR